jgi:hypothetical protein
VGYGLALFCAMMCSGVQCCAMVCSVVSAVQWGAVVCFGFCVHNACKGAAIGLRFLRVKVLQVLCSVVRWLMCAACGRARPSSILAVLCAG